MAETVLILVDIEQTQSALGLLERARDRFAGADLHIAHVMPFGFYSYVEPLVSKESHDQAAEQARAQLTSLAARAGCEDATLHLLRGGIGEQAILLAKKLDADIVAVNAVRLGSTLSTLGTHAAQIARHAPCAVYIDR
ncbi:MAG: universal stress protein [Devosiaceae bacterium]|nr:universal stress protein [Devosiaceae bacterium MH13]